MTFSSVPNPQHSLLGPTGAVEACKGDSGSPLVLKGPDGCVGQQMTAQVGAARAHALIAVKRGGRHPRRCAEAVSTLAKLSSRKGRPLRCALLGTVVGNKRRDTQVPPPI